MSLGEPGIIRRFLAGHRRAFVLTLASRIGFELLPMLVPVCAGLAVSALTDADHTAREDRLLLAGLGLTAVACGHGVLSWARTRSTARLTRAFVRDLRSRTAAALMALPLDRHRDAGLGDLWARAVSDVGATRTYLDRVFIQTTTGVLRMTVPVLMMLLLAPLLALGVLAVLPLQSLLVRGFQSRLAAASRAARSEGARLAARFQEALAGIETVQGLGAERAMGERLRSASEAVEHAELAAQRWAAWTSATICTVTGLGLAGAWYFGALAVAAGRLQLGELVAFCGFASFAFQPFRRFGQILNTRRRGLACIERIEELLDSVPAASAASDGVAGPALTGACLEIRPVGAAATTFVGPGLFCLIGRAGAGKSRMLRQFAGLEPAAPGRLFLDGCDVQFLGRPTLARVAALVPEQAVLFPGTLAANLGLGTARSADWDEALELSGSAAYVAGAPAGLDTEIGPGAVWPDALNARRLVLARVLATGAPLLLLDEPCSGLDDHDAAQLWRTLQQVGRRRTLLVATHRADLAASAAARCAWPGIGVEGSAAVDATHGEEVLR